MINKSYEHPLLRVYSASDLTTELVAHSITENTPNAKDTKVRMVIVKDNDLRPFYHPVILKGNDVFIDARTYTKVDRDGGYKVTNETEFDLATMRAELELIWQGDGRYALNNLKTVPGQYYVKWFAQAYTFLYNLSPANYMKVSIASGLYFFCQFLTPEEWDDDTVNKAVSFISRVTGAPATMVAEYVDFIKYIPSATFFVELLRNLVSDGTFDKLDTRVHYNIISNGWRGVHGKEVGMLASDYPPAFMASVVAAATDRSFRNTPLQVTIDMTKKSIDSDEFVNGLKSTILTLTK